MEFDVYSVWEKEHCWFDGIEETSEVIFSAWSLSELFVLQSGPLIGDGNLPNNYNLNLKIEGTLHWTISPTHPSPALDSN